MEYKYYTKPNCYEFKYLFNEMKMNEKVDKWLTPVRDDAAALHAKVNQFYDSSRPYVFHLDMVADQFLQLYKQSIVRGGENCDLDPELVYAILFAIYFHDTIEDCRIHYCDVLGYAKKYLVKKYQEWAADMVFAVTEEKGKTRKDRHNKKYWDGIAQVPYAYCVKMSDMCANAMYSWMTNPKRYDSYTDELRENYLSMADEYSDYFSVFSSTAVEHIRMMPLRYTSLCKDVYKELLLSKDEMVLIDKVVSDWLTGQYLIRERSKEYMKSFYDIMMAVDKPLEKKTEKEKQITEYFNATQEPWDYDTFCRKYGIKKETKEQ